MAGSCIQPSTPLAGVDRPGDDDQAAALLAHPFFQQVRSGRRRAPANRDRRPRRSRSRTFPRAWRGSRRESCRPPATCPACPIAAARRPWSSGRGRTGCGGTDTRAWGRRPATGRGSCGRRFRCRLRGALSAGLRSDSAATGCGNASVRRPGSSGVSSNFTGTTSPSPPSVTCRLSINSPAPCRAASAPSAGGPRKHLHRDHLAGHPLGLHVAGHRVMIARIGPGRHDQIAHGHVGRLPVGAQADGEDGDFGFLGQLDGRRRARRPHSARRRSAG